MPTVGALTHTGKGLVMNRLKGNGAEPIYVGWGTGGTAADPTDTALETPASEARQAGTTTIETTTVADDTYQVDATITADGAKTITEVGNFDAAADGNIMMRVTFDGIPVESGDTIRFLLGYQTVDPA